MLAPFTSSDPEDSAHASLDPLPARNGYPTYLDESFADDEEELTARKVDLETEQRQIKERLEEARRVKRILYYTGIDLEAEVVRFLDVELGIPAR